MRRVPAVTARVGCALALASLAIVPAAHADSSSGDSGSGGSGSGSGSSGGASGTTAGGSSGGGSDAVSSGGTPLGDANGQVLTVAPVAGELALPVKVITSGARVEDQVSRGSAATVDAGLLGSLATLALTNAPTLAKLGLDTTPFRSFQLPGVTNADSRTVTEASDNPVIPKLDGGVFKIGGGNQYASAQPKGEGHGRTEGGSLTIDLGVVKLSASGLVSDSVAGPTMSSSTTSLGELTVSAFGVNFVGRGLEWKVSQQIDQPAQAQFSVGAIEFGGTRYAAPTPDQITAAFDQLNTALVPTGLSIQVPKAEVSAAGGKISPLGVTLRNSQGAALVVGPLYEQLLSDVVNQVENAIVTGVPETGLAITVANVAIAAAVGRGGAGVALGGGDARLIRTPVETYSYEPLEGGQAPFDSGSLGGSSDLGTSMSSPTSDSGSLGSTSGSTYDSGAASLGAATSLPKPSGAARAKSAGATANGRTQQAAAFGPVVADEKVPAVLLLIPGLGLALALAGFDRNRIRRLLEASR